MSQTTKLRDRTDQMLEGSLELTTTQDGGARRTIAFPAGGVKKIAVDCRAYDIEVTSADVEEIIAFWDIGTGEVIFSEATGSLIHMVESALPVLRSLPDTEVIDQRKTLRIVLPESYTGDMVLRTVTGNMGLSDIRSVGSVDIKSPHGRIDIKKTTMQKDLRADGAEEGILMEGVSVGGVVFLQTVAGSIRVQDAMCGGFTVVSLSGACDLCNIHVEGCFSVSVDAGYLEFDKICADRIDVTSINSRVDTRRLNAGSSIAIHTQAGDIICRVGDTLKNYACYCFSNHGECNVPYHMGIGNKELHVDSDRGIVDIRFEQSEAGDLEGTDCVGAADKKMKLACAVG